WDLVAGGEECGEVLAVGAQRGGEPAQDVVVDAVEQGLGAADGGQVGAQVAQEREEGCRGAGGAEGALEERLGGGGGGGGRGMGPVAGIRIRRPPLGMTKALPWAAETGVSSSAMATGAVSGPRGGSGRTARWPTMPLEPDGAVNGPNSRGAELVTLIDPSGAA